MRLALPPQTAPDSGSFPQDRDSVRTWLEGLSPAREPEHAAELLRGLRHSNRLTNDSIGRRVILNEFRPTLNDLTHSLTDSVTPQPLPMAAPFRHASVLLDELLREEVNTWKILLSDCQQPEIADASHALTALYRQAVAAVQQYRRVPRHCLRDANQIYALAETQGLLNDKQSAFDTRLSLVDELVNAYAGILILATFDLRQIRARQLDLTLAFLAEHHDDIQLNTGVSENAWRHTDYVVNLSGDQAPITAASYLGDLSHPDVRWISFATLMESVQNRLARTRTTLSVTLGADTLERQTLTRLSHELAGNRSRKNARCISYNKVQLAFGHQQISNQLLRSVDASKQQEADSDALVVWTRTNHSTQGAAFSSLEPDIGSTQVGELVALYEENDSTTLGMVRWVHADEDGAIAMGVEFISNGVIPVELTRENAEEGVTDEALIIACRISGKVTQTILLPGYRFNTGDRLTARQLEKRKVVKLGQCLQSNGLFSHYVLNEG